MGLAVKGAGEEPGTPISAHRCGLITARNSASHTAPGKTVGAKELGAETERGQAADELVSAVGRLLGR